MTVRRKDRHYLVAVWLAAIAVAGLLAMHGLNPAVFESGQASSHGLHGIDTGDEVVHAAVGLCVFTVVGFIGLALLTSPKQGGNLRNLPRLHLALLNGPTGVPAAGRRLLADLCVLRL